MNSYNLQFEIDKVASQLEGLDFQFQTALDVLIESHSGESDLQDRQTAADNVSVHHTSTAKTDDDNMKHRNISNLVLTPLNSHRQHKAQDKDCLESEAADCTDSQHCSKTLEDDRSATHEDTNSEIDSQKETRGESTRIWSGPSKDQHLTGRRSHPSNVTIVRISASNQHIVKSPVAKCTSRVKIDKFIKGKEPSKNRIEGQTGIEDLKAGDNVTANKEENKHIVTNGVKWFLSADTNQTSRSPLDSDHGSEKPGAKKQVWKVSPSKIKRSKSVTISKDQGEVSQLERHCKSLESELEGVKSEIVRMIREKEGCLKENALLKQMSQEKEALAKENDRLRMIIQQMLDEGSCNMPKTILEKEDSPLPDRSSPDGQEMNIYQLNDIEEKDDSISFKNSERIRMLEESLELMKVEFEAMEEYWRERVETERNFYEDQIEKSEIVVSELQKQVENFIQFLMKQDTKEPIRSLSIIME